MNIIIRITKGISNGIRIRFFTEKEAKALIKYLRPGDYMVPNTSIHFENEAGAQAVQWARNAITDHTAIML